MGWVGVMWECRVGKKYRFEWVWFGWGRDGDSMVRLTSKVAVVRMCGVWWLSYYRHCAISI